MRVVAATIVLLALYAGCSNANKKKEPSVETKDGPRVGPLTGIRELTEPCLAYWHYAANS